MQAAQWFLLRAFKAQETERAVKSVGRQWFAITDIIRVLRAADKPAEKTYMEILKQGWAEKFSAAIVKRKARDAGWQGSFVSTFATEFWKKFLNSYLCNKLR